MVKRRRSRRPRVPEEADEEEPALEFASEDDDEAGEPETWEFEGHEVQTYEIVDEYDDEEEADEKEAPSALPPDGQRAGAQKRNPADEIGTAAATPQAQDPLKETLESYIRDLREVVGSLTYLDLDEEEQAQHTADALTMLHEAMGFVNGLELGAMVSVEQAAELREALEGAEEDVREGRPREVSRYLKQVAAVLVDL